MNNKIETRMLQWNEANLPLFGTDVDKQIHKEAVMHDEIWKTLLHQPAPRLFVWKVDKFRLKFVYESDYGNFYSNNTYVVLSIDRGRMHKMAYNVHVWVGMKSLYEEYCTAVHKALELDMLFSHEVMLHREVETFESKMFKSYFSSYRIMCGDMNSAFNPLAEDCYRPRLLHYHSENKNSVEIVEVDLSVHSLNSDDVFILDLGHKMIQWNGGSSNKEERYGAAQLLNQMVNERNGKCKTYVMDELLCTDNEDFIRMLPNTPVQKHESIIIPNKSIHRLTLCGGGLTYNLVVDNALIRSKINENDVHFLNTGNHLFVYLGSRCKLVEKQNALSYAHNFVKRLDNCYMPVTVITFGQRSAILDHEWDSERCCL